MRRWRSCERVPGTYIHGLDVDNCRFVGLCLLHTEGRLNGHNNKFLETPCLGSKLVKTCNFFFNFLLYGSNHSPGTLYCTYSTLSVFTNFSNSNFGRLSHQMFALWVEIRQGRQLLLQFSSFWLKS